MKALTVRQPWAWAIAVGEKTVENRGWPTRYRGPLAIHAAKAPDLEGWTDPAIGRAMDSQEPGPMAYGAVIAVVEVTGCHPAARRWPTCCQPWGFEDQYHFELAGARRLPEPVPAKGRLGLWNWEAS